MKARPRQPREIIFDIDRPFEELWEASGVKEVYWDLVDERINYLVENLFSYDPSEVTLATYKAAVQELAYTTTELLAQFCAGGFRWNSTDKVRYLSPTVDLVTVIQDRAADQKGSLGEYFGPVQFGVWEFLEVSEDTKSWIEAQALNRKQIEYLLWSATKALRLLKADERILGFTDVVLSESRILDGYSKCESPIESILYMQLVVDGLRPPVLESQYSISSYRADFAIPRASLLVECDGKKYHDRLLDAERDTQLMELGWRVLRFPAERIVTDPSWCSARIHDEYPWRLQQTADD